MGGGNLNQQINQRPSW